MIQNTSILRQHLAYITAKIGLWALSNNLTSLRLWLNNIRLRLNGQKPIHYCNWRPLMEDGHIVCMYCKKCGKEHRF